MQFLDSIIHKAQANRQTIVLAEGEDSRVIEAAQRATDNGIANCVLVGNENTIRNQAGNCGGCVSTRA
jgi:phosphate acetyltransferase